MHGTDGGTRRQATVRFEGDLDGQGILSLRDAVFTAIGARPDVLLIDLSAVAFVDTAGLETLLTVARVAQKVRVAVALRPAPHLRRLLHATGLAQVLTLTDSATTPGDAENAEDKE